MIFSGSMVEKSSNYFSVSHFDSKIPLAVLTGWSHTTRDTRFTQCDTHIFYHTFACTHAWKKITHNHTFRYIGYKNMCEKYVWKRVKRVKCVKMCVKRVENIHQFHPKNQHRMQTQVPSTFELIRWWRKNNFPVIFSLFLPAVVLFHRCYHFWRGQMKISIWKSILLNKKFNLSTLSLLILDL